MALLEGQVAIITGAGTGIGAATAIRFVAEHALVVLVGRRREKLEETAARIINVEFVGFSLANGITATGLRITKGFPSGATNDSWAVDNIRTVLVPEPTAAVLALAALCSAMSRRRDSYRVCASIKYREAFGKLD